ncbi:CGNR zinc finger domain-containing protein [Candidatus Neomarinimicrobiota bacterium]
MSTYSEMQIDADFVGGALCLDFANTYSEDDEGSDYEVFATFGEFIKWAEHAKILTSTEAEDFYLRSLAEPAVVGQLLEEIKTLRHNLHRIFFAIAEDVQPPAKAVDGLNSTIETVYSKLRLEPKDQRYDWSWAGWSEDLAAPIWPVVRSAAELLNSTELVRTRKCHNETCSWLFVDKSKNHSRRWCDMDVCGNRAKARKHYRKTRTSTN